VVKSGLRIGLSVGTVVFGLIPLVAPRWFARQFGLPHDGPASAVLVRSLGGRDLLNGVGLVATLGNPRRHRSWLWLRTALDLIDMSSSMAALRLDRRNYRLAALGAIAAGASVVDMILLATTSGSPKR